MSTGNAFMVALAAFAAMLSVGPVDRIVLMLIAAAMAFLAAWDGGRAE